MKWLLDKHTVPETKIIYTADYRIRNKILRLTPNASRSVACNVQEEKKPNSNKTAWKIPRVRWGDRVEKLVQAYGIRSDWERRAELSLDLQFSWRRHENVVDFFFSKTCAQFLVLLFIRLFNNGYKCGMVYRHIWECLFFYYCTVRFLEYIMLEDTHIIFIKLEDRLCILDVPNSNIDCIEFVASTWTSINLPSLLTSAVHRLTANV